MGQVIEQGRRRLARPPAGQVPGVVFDTGAITDFHHHFQVEPGALFQALQLDQLVGAAELFQAFGQFFLDGLYGLQDNLPFGDIMGLGVDGDARDLPVDLAGQRIEDRYGFDLVIKQFHPYPLAL